MQFCNQCVLPETYPGIEFDAAGVCNLCRRAADDRRRGYDSRFADEEALLQALRPFRRPENQYDVVVPLSGGVDSSFTLIQMVERFKLRPLVFHNDHGYDSPIAVENVTKLCRDLDVDMILWKNDYSFMRRLFKYFNEARERDLSACYVCGNMLYLNGLEIADRFGVPLVVNGYSKGQAAMMHNKEWSQSMYGKMIEIILETGDQEFFQSFCRKWELLKKQTIYQARADLEKPLEPGKILFIPFFVFQFFHTDKEALKEYCRQRFDWRPIPASYPARTTNCDMIWLNSHRDLCIRGYTHYHDEYSTLIRAGEMTREQALADLRLDPPPGMLERLAGECDIDLAGIAAASPVDGSAPTPRDEKKILLAMTPYWTPLIPPLGMACLKGFLQHHGYTVKTVDFNADDEFIAFANRYYECLQSHVPEDHWGNFYVTGKDVLQNHLMAWLHREDEARYRELVAILVEKTFYCEVTAELVDRLCARVDDFYRSLEVALRQCLLAERPAVFGLSVFEGSLPASLFAARLARALDPRVRVVMGGGVFAEQLAAGSPNWEPFLEKADAVESFLIGEGELLFLHWLRGELPPGKRIYTIADIDNRVLPPEEAPLPDFSDLTMSRYLLASTYASRSCPFQCKFCSETVQWGKYRMKSAPQIVSEFRALHRQTNRQLFLVCDSLLNAVATPLARALAESDPPIYWDGYLRADVHAADPETTLMWRRGGFYKAKLGLESGSPRVLELMDKRITVDLVRRTLSALAYAGIKTSTCWIVGYPGETEEDFQQTLDLLEEMKDDIYEVWASPFYYYPSGQVDMRAWAQRRELLYPEWARDLLLIQTWVPLCEPSRPEMYRRMNRFVEHCRNLGLPNPYTLAELYKADERWKRLHENAVPGLADFARGESIDDRRTVKKLVLAGNTVSLDGDFAF